MLSIPASLARAVRGATEELRHASHRASRHAAQDRTPRVVAGAEQILLKSIVAHAPRCAGDRVTAIVSSTRRTEVRTREALRHRPFQPARPARTVAGTIAAGEDLCRAKEGSRSPGAHELFASSIPSETHVRPISQESLATRPSAKPFLAGFPRFPTSQVPRTVGNNVLVHIDFLKVATPCESAS